MVAGSGASFPGGFPGPSFSVIVRAGVMGTSAALAHGLLSEGVRVIAETGEGEPHAVIVDLIANPSGEVLVETAKASRAPVIAAIGPEHLTQADLLAQADDVIVMPWRPAELAMRIARLVARLAPAAAPGVIHAGDLVIDTNRYDVYLTGKPVLLTFKEYELLKLLAANPGRVYSREALLEQVWGYQYFGGTRTVDVHVRRLRSKIEIAGHTFIETVWNVGYRFRG